MRLLFIALAWLAALTAASARSPALDYAVVLPGACVQQSPDLRAAWQAGMDLLAAGDPAGARSAFQRCAQACPDDPAPLHMSALAAWAGDQTATAIRLLVQTTRMRQAPPVSSIALAALYADSPAPNVPLGWLRRGLQQAPPEEHAYWVTRPAFTRIMMEADTPWTELLAEFQLPTDPAVLEALSTPPDRPGLEPLAIAEPIQPLLRLSLFDPGKDSVEQAALVRKQVEQNLIDRVRPPVESQPALDPSEWPAEETPQPDTPDATRPEQP